MHSSNIINLSPSDDLNKYIKKPGPCVLDFSARWCGPCQRLSPILHEAAKNYKFTLVIIDVDNNKNISAQYGISGIPHVYLYIDGKLKMEFTGFDQNKLSEMIKLASSNVNKFFFFFCKKNVFIYFFFNLFFKIFLHHIMIFSI